MGGADIVRQALEARLVDGLLDRHRVRRPRERQALFDGFSGSFNLEHLGVFRQSPHATFIDYRINRPE